MKGRPILVEYADAQRSLREIGRLIGVAPRTMAHRWASGKRGADLLAPPDERMKRRGRWQVGNVVATSCL